MSRQSVDTGGLSRKGSQALAITNVMPLLITMQASRPISVNRCNMVGGEVVEATPYELLRDKTRALRLARLTRRPPLVRQDILLALCVVRQDSLSAAPKDATFQPMEDGNTVSSSN
jgi:hypothetical protein